MEVRTLQEIAIESFKANHNAILIFMKTSFVKKVV